MQRGPNQSKWHFKNKNKPFQAPGLRAKLRTPTLKRPPASSQPPSASPLPCRHPPPKPEESPVGFALRAKGAKWSQLPQRRWSEREVPTAPGCFPKLALEAAAPSSPTPAQAIALLVPGTSNAGLGQHSPLPYRSALRLPLGAGCPGRLRVGGADGSGLVVPSYGPPSPQRPPE